MLQSYGGALTEQDVSFWPLAALLWKSVNVVSDNYLLHTVDRHVTRFCRHDDTTRIRYRCKAQNAITVRRTHGYGSRNQETCWSMRSRDACACKFAATGEFHFEKNWSNAFNRDAYRLSPTEEFRLWKFAAIGSIVHQFLWSPASSQWNKLMEKNAWLEWLKIQKPRRKFHFRMFASIFWCSHGCATAGDFNVEGLACRQCAVRTRFYYESLLSFPLLR